MTLFTCWLVLLLLASPRRRVNLCLAQQAPPLESLLFPPCNETSLQMWKQSSAAKNDFEPCLMYHVEPSFHDLLLDDEKNNQTRTATENNRTAVITTLMVTDTACPDWRDGALLGIQKLNSHNNNNGVALGYYKDYYVKFRHVSVIPGNRQFLGTARYQQRHQAVLEQLLQYYTRGPHNEDNNTVTYIIGTCSWAAHMEVELAEQYQTILLAQVGPSAFYTQQQPPNPWLFGMHIDSDEYPIDATRRLQFYQQGLLFSQEQENNKPQTTHHQQQYIQRNVSVVYRTQSEFFKSTCQSAIQSLRQATLPDGSTPLFRVIDLPYDPEEVQNNNGILNQDNVKFLQQLADQACPQQQQPDDDDDAAAEQQLPAVFLCTLSEHDVILERFRQNGCRLITLWITAATWAWAWQNPTVVPYIKGGGQWHAAMKYSDEYYESGTAVLQHGQEQFGYTGQYDMMVSYAIAVLFAQHLQATYRVSNDPTPLTDDAEYLRRQLLNLRVDTIFGPVSFDHNQRNVGRGAAASQWLPRSSSSTASTTAAETPTAAVIALAGLNQTVTFQNALVSPLNHADAASVIPPPCAWECQAGAFVNNSRTQTDDGILQAKCSLCPVDTFSTTSNRELACHSCPLGSSTEGRIGQMECVQYEDDLLSAGILSFGYTFMGISWTMGLFFIGWIVYHRQDPVVQVAQPRYLVLICLGGIISTAAILVLAYQAGTGEDTTTATRACRTVPFLYAFGWVLQYSSLSAKTLRLYKLVDSSMHLIRSAAVKSELLVMGALVVDMALVTLWTIIDPLEYRRDIVSRNVDDGMVTISTTGRCQPGSDEGNHYLFFVVPILACHFILMIVTHWLLFKVRSVNDRYQEQKSIGMAAIFALEVVLVGTPILVASRDSVESSFIVMVAIVALDNIGTTCCIFVPKIIHQRKGLERGVSVGESILVGTHQRAVERERQLQEMKSSFSSKSSIDSSGVLRNDSFSTPVKTTVSSINLSSAAQSSASNMSESLSSSRVREGSESIYSRSTSSVLETLMTAIPETGESKELSEEISPDEKNS